MERKSWINNSRVEAVDVTLGSVGDEADDEPPEDWHLDADEEPERNRQDAERGRDDPGEDRQEDQESDDGEDRAEHVPEAVA